MTTILCKLSLISLILLSLYTNVTAQNKVALAMNDKVVKKTVPLLEHELKNSELELGNPIYIRVIKKTDNYPDFGELEIWIQMKNKNTYCLFKSYPICYYSGGLGFKMKEGDKKTPEGFYSVIPSNLNQYSNYHRGFDIAYPNVYDRKKKYTGSQIMIHGDCVSIGCIAMTDALIEEIWTLVVYAMHKGQKEIPVHIFPFVPNPFNLEKFSNPQYNSFWENLKEGYDFFEKNKIPPKIKMGEKYEFY